MGELFLQNHLWSYVNLEITTQPLLTGVLLGRSREAKSSLPEHSAVLTSGQFLSSLPLPLSASLTPLPSHARPASPPAQGHFFVFWVEAALDLGFPVHFASSSQSSIASFSINPAEPTLSLRFWNIDMR